jgi:hypothetical protein
MVLPVKLAFYTALNIFIQLVAYTFARGSIDKKQKGTEE